MHFYSISQMIEIIIIFCALFLLCCSFVLIIWNESRYNYLQIISTVIEKPFLLFSLTYDPFFRLRRSIRYNMNKMK